LLKKDTLNLYIFIRFVLPKLLHLSYNVNFVFGQNKEQNNNKEENNEKKESDKGGVVLKANIHCEGCSDQISKCLRGFEGN
jgi:hypothetical protein